MMKSKAELIEHIENMNVGEEYFFNMSQEGGALTKRLENGYDLYEIPIYGGAEQWSGHYTNDQIHDMVTEALTWC